MEVLVEIADSDIILNLPRRPNWWIHHKSHQLLQTCFRSSWFGSSSTLIQKLLQKFFQIFGVSYNVMSYATNLKRPLIWVYINPKELPNPLVAFVV